MELICYTFPAWKPRIRPAARERDWMEATPERYAYRCLPLAIANAHGWEILSPVGFEARWNGGGGVESVQIIADEGADPRQVPVSLFGSGTITFHIEGIFRTPPGWNLWASGSPNSAKDGIAPLGGVIETDWSPYTFTMNWRFTRPDHWVRFEENEPFCFVFPVQRKLLQDIEPEIRSLDEVPELKQEFLNWSESRKSFQKWVEETKPTAPADRWQKLYYRGVCPNGSRGAKDHISKLRLEPFEGVEIPQPPAPAPAAALAVEAVPELDGVVARDPADFKRFIAESVKRQFSAAGGATEMTAMLSGGGFQGAPKRAGAGLIASGPAAAKARGSSAATDPTTQALARRDWYLDIAERQRRLSPRADRIEEVSGISSDEFLDRFYAPGRPVLIRGEMKDWPALSRWTPDYLKRVVGSAEIEFQGGRNTSESYELHKENHKRRMPFDAYMDLIADEESGNDAYLTAYNSATNKAALAPLQTDLGVLDRFLTAAPGMMWVGPGGTFTPLHFDLTNNLLAQVVGTKYLTLVPPSETGKLAHHRHVFSDVHDITDPERLERYPQAADARQFDVELNAGDLLYIPVGWWHQVAAESFSVTLTYTNFLWPNDAHETYPSADR